MNLAADMRHHFGRATPSLRDAPYRQFEKATGRRSTYPLPIAVQTNPATSVRLVRMTDLASRKDGLRALRPRTRGTAAKLATIRTTATMTKTSPLHWSPLPFERMFTLTSNTTIIRNGPVATVNYDRRRYHSELY
jgi:hypothetical protein